MADGGGQGGSEWTVDTLREHTATLLAEMDLRYQQRYDAQIKALDAALLAAEKAVDAALKAAERAVAKAEAAAERRFESVNEFRATLADQAAQLMSRAEAQALLDAVDVKLAALDEKVDANSLRTEKMASATGGMKEGWQLLLGLVALAATAVTVYLALRG